MGLSNRRPVIWYGAQVYRSFRRTAIDYARLFALGHRFTDRLSEAEVVVMHGEPRVLRRSLERLPELPPVPRVGITLWEADALVDGVWDTLRTFDVLAVPSISCRDTFMPLHPRVRVVPYVMRSPRGCSARARERAAELLDVKGAELVFLHVADARNIRKNTRALVDGFLEAGIEGALLAVVGWNSPEPSPARVRTLPGNLPPSLLTALYERADAVVSAHHAEGWGLALSDGMLHRRLVVATGHSGNLMFMDAENSILIPPNVGPIRRKDHRPGLFEPHMRWANPRRRDIAAALVKAAAELRSGAAAGRIELASRSVRRYRPSAVAPLLLACLDEARECRSSAGGRA